MSIDINKLSNVIALPFYQTSFEREENRKYCHVCLSKTKLTREHIPPKKAFNNYNKLWDRLILNDDSIRTQKVHIPTEGSHHSASLALASESQYLFPTRDDELPKEAKSSIQYRPHLKFLKSSQLVKDPFWFVFVLICIYLCQNMAQIWLT